MLEIEKAWAAGFFDGEGCVGCVVSRTLSPIRPVCEVQVANNDQEPVLWFRDHFFPSRKIHRMKKSAACWKVMCRDRGMLREFFGAVRPYCRVKGPQVDVALRMLIAQEEGDTESLWALREELRLAKGANVGGPKPRPRSHWT